MAHCASRSTSNGLGDSPERLRRLASLLWSVVDELAELQGIADAMHRHPAGRGIDAFLGRVGLG
jgi:hypothetical protein